jgi:predicted metal-dependent phosphoesterase TrpH
MIDLHTHSTFSDGSLSPAELVERARQAGLTALALTDHDGMLGIDAFMEACGCAGIRGVPGVEISVDFGPGTLHMLGLFLDHRDPVVEAALIRLRGARKERNLRILEKINGLGMALTWDEVAAFAKQDVVGRPHFSMALIHKGYVRDKTEAFDRFLAKGKPAYADRYRLTAAESIAMIRGAGGVPVLAHPFTLGLERNRLREFVAGLAREGLQGLEVYYSEHNAEQQKQCLAMAQEAGLALSGGSDFHGDLNPDVRLGVGFGNLNVPDEWVNLLYARVQRG